MKRILLTGFVLSTLIVQAQTTIRPNRPTATGEGFIFDFSGSKEDNCLPILDDAKNVIVYPTATNSNYGERFGIGKEGLKIDYDAAGGGYLKAIYDGTQSMDFPDNIIDIRFPKSDCTYGSIPVNLTHDTSFSAVIETSVDMQLGMMLLASNEFNSGSTWADNNYDTTTFKAGVKKIWKGKLPRRAQGKAKTLNLTKCTALGIKLNGTKAIAGTIKIFKLEVGDAHVFEVVNIPDINFLARLIQYGIDVNKDGKIQTNEAIRLTAMDLRFNKIASLIGIEAFTALTTLNCSSNQLTSLDVSKNIALTTLFCYSNQLTSLDVSKNIALTSLWCYSNPSLTCIQVSNSQLQQIDYGFDSIRDSSATFSEICLTDLTENEISTQKTFTKIYSIYGQEVNNTYQGLVIITYSDGTSKRMIQ